MNVFVLQDYEDFGGVYSTLEKAVEAAGDRDWGIAEYEVDGDKVRFYRANGTLWWENGERL